MLPRPQLTLATTADLVYPADRIPSFAVTKAMYAEIPIHANALQVATQSDRIAREQKGNHMALVFSAITAISLGAAAAKTIFDMMHQKAERHHAHAQEREKHAATHARSR